MYVHGFRRPEGLHPVNALQRLALDRSPNSIARRIRRHRIVRSPAPHNSLRGESLERNQTKRALRSEVARVVVADPPGERRLQLRISGVVLFLQSRHHFDGVIGRLVAVDDSVTHSLHRFILQHLRVSVHHPVNRAIPDGVRTDVYASAVNHPHHLAINFRIRVWITLVPGILAGGILVPIVVHPRGARAAAAVHKNLHAARQQQAIERLRRLRQLRNMIESFLGSRDSDTAQPKRENPHTELVLGQKLAIQLPILGNNTRVFDRRHTFFVEIGHDAKQSIALLLVRVGRNQMPHQILGGFLEHTGGFALRVAIDGSRRRILGLARDARELHGSAVRGSIMPRGMFQPHRIVGRYFVQVGSVKISKLREFAFVPAAATHPLSGF